MHSQHDVFVEAVKKKRKIIVTYFSGVQSLYLTKSLVPLKYLSSGLNDGNGHYFFCELEAEANERIITLSSLGIQYMEISDDYSNPDDYILDKKD